MRHFRLEYILLYLHRISVFTQNLGQTRPVTRTLQAQVPDLLLLKFCHCFTSFRRKVKQTESTPFCGCFIGQNQNNSAKEPSLPKRKFLGNNGSFCVLYSFLVLRASRPGIPPIKFCDFARGAVKIYAQIYLQAPAE